MDLITKSCVKEFLETNEIGAVSQATDFEKFASFCVVANEYSGSFDASDILTDDDTQGIDAIAPQAKGKNIPLPHLVRRGPLEKPRSSHVS